MSSAVFGKTFENVRVDSNIKLVIRERKINYLVSEPNYHTIKFFADNLLVTKMRKTQILMIKPVYLGLLILDLSNTVIHEFYMVRGQNEIIWIQAASLFM